MNKDMLSNLESFEFNYGNLILLKCNSVLNLLIIILLLVSYREILIDDESCTFKYKHDGAFLFLK